ncbi:hypothetical protein [Dryocola clanedunensis]|uniref:hypothetical protein n=1 Tax=Cedecea sulfonylureivorans TaxID=3051154 RepID=UPI0019263824|nr:hypothetical protein [Cedecea sulfonylureivorans]
MAKSKENSDEDFIEMVGLCFSEDFSSRKKIDALINSVFDNENAENTPLASGEVQKTKYSI